MYVSLLSPRLHKAYKARCVSLPVRLHPSVRRIQEVSPGLELWGHLRWSRGRCGLINELLEVSSKYLEVCGGAKDGASRIKKSVVELQSALRRSKKGGDFSLEGEVMLTWRRVKRSRRRSRSIWLL
ncbi:hypothetical protein Rs2_37376 [Raphanus sativus]|nr:hypothetical protein Rs2_37376 [Raphanus sativus]